MLSFPYLLELQHAIALNFNVFDTNILHLLSASHYITEVPMHSSDSERIYMHTNITMTLNN